VSTVKRNQGEINDPMMATSMPNEAMWPSGAGTDRAHRRIRQEWIETARIIDRFFFVVFVVIIIDMITILLIVSAVLGSRKVEPL